MILEKLQEDRILFRKEAKLKELEWATILYSEIVKIGKDKENRESTEEEAISVIKTFLKNIDFTILNLKDKNIEYLKLERDFYLSYLPKQLTYVELENEIKSYIIKRNLCGGKSLGAIMQFLNTNFNGQFNGKEASEITKKLLLI